MDSKILMVVGMHRSGTSLITKWLHETGLFIGNNLETGNIGNPEGHFEDQDFLKLHKSFLQTRDLPSTGFVDSSLASLIPDEKNELEKLIKTRNADHREWGWKEPRTVLFLGMYKKLIPSAHYIFISRNYNDTVSSMITREYRINRNNIQSKKGLSKLKWQLLKRKNLEHLFIKYAEPYLRAWIFYSEEMLKHAHSLPASQFQFVQYIRLSHDDRLIFNRLTKEWHFSLQHVPFTRIFKKELLSEAISIKKYIRDQTLLKKAAEIENCLNQHASMP